MTSKNKTKTYLSFYMISSSFPQVIFKAEKECPMAVLVLFGLIECSNDFSACFITERNLANDLGISVNSTYHALKYLHNNGYLDIISYGRDNLYIINTNLFWHTTANIRKLIAQDMGFFTPYYLTKVNNRKYFNMHKRLISHRDRDYRNSNIMQIIRDHRKYLLPAVSNKTYVNNQRDAKAYIMKIIRKDQRPQKDHNGNTKRYWTPKEMLVVEYVVKYTPALPGKMLHESNISLMTRLNTSKRKHFSYAIVARALAKLKAAGIIGRRHGLIFFNPQLIPLIKNKYAPKHIKREVQIRKNKIKLRQIQRKSIMLKKQIKKDNETISKQKNEKMKNGHRSKRRP